jgi:hypothetical protein
MRVWLALLLWLLTASSASAQLTTTALGRFGGNPCVHPAAPIQSSFTATSGTSAVQIIALVAGQKIYLCSINIVGVSGTSPTFSLVYGTGTNCATGQTKIIGVIATGTNTLYAPSPGGSIVVPTANAVCYLDGGTSPVQQLTLTYVQQ